jgi:HSP20 family protein
MTKGKKKEEEASFGGVFKGLADLIEKLGDLAEKGEKLRKSGEFQHKDIKGVYGFSVKMGLGEKGEKAVKVEPFGNVRRDEKSGETVVQEIREPVVDVFEENDHVLIVAEMPGISTKDVVLSVEDDLLTITAEKKDKRYRKEILLPRAYPQEKMKMTCNNGILEIRCTL